MVRDYFLCSLLVCVILVDTVLLQQFEFVNPIRFPYASRGNPFMGMFVAIALPIDIRGPADLFISTNFESSYPLPSNQSALSYPPIISSTREIFYHLLESKIDGYGYPGKLCVQRAVCEAAEYTTENYGILGDIIHILLTPSSSKNETGMEDYFSPEQYGKSKGHCKKYRRKCRFSILNLFSKVKDVYQLYKPFLINKDLSLT